MANERTLRSVRSLLRSERGQSWVETVVMLPVIVVLLLGLFYLHDLVATRIRAIQAARFVAWESTWYVREDRENRAMESNEDLKKKLKKIGLGQGLKNVDVFKRRVSQYKSDVSPGKDAALFIPGAISNLIGNAFGGGDESGSFINDLAGSLSGVLNGLTGLAGDAAFFFQDLMAKNTNWDDEMNGSVYTARVIYKMSYSGIFQHFGVSTIVQRQSVLSHPYNVKRSTDDQEYSDLLGSPCDFDTKGHVVKLWLFPQGGVPPITSGGDSAQSVTDGINGALNLGGGIAKCIVAGPGSALGALDSVLGSSLGFTMPDGTLKEYPELNTSASTGSSSGNGSGGGLGGCENGSGGIGGQFSGCQ